MPATPSSCPTTNNNCNVSFESDHLLLRGPTGCARLGSRSRHHTARPLCSRHTFHIVSTSHVSFDSSIVTRPVAGWCRVRSADDGAVTALPLPLVLFARRLSAGERLEPEPG